MKRHSQDSMSANNFGRMSGSEHHRCSSINKMWANSKGIERRDNLKGRHMHVACRSSKCQNTGKIGALGQPWPRYQEIWQPTLRAWFINGVKRRWHKTLSVFIAVSFKI